MTTPSFSAEASLYGIGQHYGFTAVRAARKFDSVVAQQLCRHLGQSCGGIDLFCCPGLRCTTPLGGHGIRVPDLYHCSPCIHGRQFCCPPLGFDAPCFVRSSITPL
jgi:hypothetical protein